jgi:hypothetical protein
MTFSRHAISVQILLLPLRAGKAVSKMNIKQSWLMIVYNEEKYNTDHYREDIKVSE